MSARQKRVTRQIRAALEAAKVGIASTNGLIHGWPAVKAFMEFPIDTSKAGLKRSITSCKLREEW